MMSYLLLKDKRVCPQCHFRVYPKHFRHCSNSQCHALHFLRPINFKLFEEEGGFRQYYVWTETKGWMHRDHFMEANAKPLEREVNIVTPPRVDYTTPEAIAAGARPKRGRTSV